MAKKNLLDNVGWKTVFVGLVIWGFVDGLVIPAVVNNATIFGKANPVYKVANTPTYAGHKNPFYSPDPWLVDRSIQNFSYDVDAAWQRDAVMLEEMNAEYNWYEGGTIMYIDGDSRLDDFENRIKKLEGSGPAPATSANPPPVPKLAGSEPASTESTGDGPPDATTMDSDGDGVVDASDLCPNTTKVEPGLNVHPDTGCAPGEALIKSKEDEVTWIKQDGPPYLLTMDVYYPLSADKAFQVSVEGGEWTNFLIVDKP